MKLEYLNPVETQAFDGFMRAGHIRSNMFVPGMSIGLDSMGPIRNPLTDKFFPRTAEALGALGETANKYGLKVVLASNGPPVEGEDVLKALDPSVSAFAITEGGGKAIFYDPKINRFNYIILAEETELDRQKELEKVVKEHPLMHALLEDKNPIDDRPPIRTPYDTNVVLTLPTEYEVLATRTAKEGVRLDQFIPDVDGSNYVDRVLRFASSNFHDAISQLDMGNQAAVIVKGQNRRVYLTPRHLHNLDELNKGNAVALASIHLVTKDQGFWVEGTDLTKEPFKVKDSIYIADKLVDRTSEGQDIIGPAEKSMVVSLTYMYEPVPDGVNVLAWHHRRIDGNLSIVDVGARLGINVTMNDAPPTMGSVEGISIVNMGSGLKALEAISYFYEQLHG